MMERMADPTARTLRLLSLLQRRRYWPGPELAARLEVSDRTLRRDVERLRELGYTIDSDRGVDGGYRLGAVTGDAALLLDDDEVTALAVALHTASSGTSELAEASLGALTKVLAMIGPAARRRVEALGAATAFGSAADGAVRLAVLDVVAAACRDRVRLSFGYVAADGAATHRYVEPYGLVKLGPRWYLVAHDADRDDWRTFRVDRMDEPVPSRNGFVPRPLPAEDLHEYVRLSLREVSNPYRVVLDVDRSADEVCARYGTWATVEPRGRRACRVTMDADSFRWPTHLIADLEAPVTVVEPPELVDHLRVVTTRLRRAAATPTRARRTTTRTARSTS